MQAGETWKGGVLLRVQLQLTKSVIAIFSRKGFNTVNWVLTPSLERLEGQINWDSKTESRASHRWASRELPTLTTVKKSRTLGAAAMTVESRSLPLAGTQESGSWDYNFGYRAKVANARLSKYFLLAEPKSWSKLKLQRSLGSFWSFIICSIPLFPHLNPRKTTIAMISYSYLV